MNAYTKFIGSALLLLTTVLGVCGHLNAQTCGSPQNCNPNLKYPYRFCVSGRFEIICTNTPNNVAGKKPYKVPLPTCVKFIASSDDPPTTISFPDKDGNPVVVNQSSDWVTAINEAVDRWNCLCGFTASNSSLNTCCIPVYWSSNARDFSGKPESTLGRFESPGIYTDVCEPVCENGVWREGTTQGPARILLNNTREFTLWSETGDKQRKSLYSGIVLPVGPGGKSLNAEYNVWSLRDVLAHEVGHWLGMRHTDELPDCEPGVTKTGIMQANTVVNKAPRTLSDQDKCQFMQLYCPLKTSVTWEEISAPTNSSKSLLLELDGGYGVIRGVDCEIISVRAYTTDGRNVGLLPFKSEPSDRSLTIDCNSLVDGVIVLVFDCSNRKEPFQRIVLIHR